MGTTQVADARFLRGIMLVLVALTLCSGVMAGVATVNAMQAQSSGQCAATGLFCPD